MEIHFGEREINSLLSKVRLFNRQIGAYETYNVNDFSCYIVKLNNGSIYFIPVDFHLDSEGSFTPEILEEISERFSNVQEEQARFQFYKSYLQKSRIVAGIVFGLAFILAFLLFYAWPEQETAFQGEIPGNYAYVPNLTENRVTLTRKMKLWESSSPVQFLSAEASWKLVSSTQVILKGEIYSAAAETIFRNAKVKLTLLSKTGKLIAEDTFTVSGLINPGEQISFRHVLEGFYGDVAKVLWEVVDAEVY